MKRLTYILKSFPLVYSIYYYLFSTLFRMLGLFVKTDEKLILFNSFGGRKFDDSPKAIYELMKQDPRFSDCRLVWALKDLNQPLPNDLCAVKSDTLRYFVLALKARCWITNSSIERGLRFKKKETFYLNTWHGSAIKKMGKDISEGNLSFKSKCESEKDIFCAQSQYDVDIFARAFSLPLSCFRQIGLPRNDILKNQKNLRGREFREKMGIPTEKIVVLYAPTFREYEKGTQHECVLSVPMNIEKWRRTLGEKYVILFRAHYEIARHMSVSGHPNFIIDVSDYPYLNDLILASDVLVSDYSSIFFDYSITHKPMYCYAYDYDKYLEHRGAYLDLKTELPCKINYTEESLLQELVEYEDSQKRREDIERVCEFQRKYVTYCGNASKLACDIIAQNIL